MTKHRLIITFFFLTLNFGCVLGQKQVSVIYETPTLKIIQVSHSAYVHISYLQTESFGKVACNGMLVISKNEAMVFDTPADETTSMELIDFIEKQKKAKVKAVVINHFHTDCLGGLDSFHAKNIKSYASNKTIASAKLNTSKIPQIGFDTSLKLKVGNKTIINQYFGEAHTKDNIVSFFKDEKILFGGCMVKELNASEGYLGDANVDSWPETIGKISNNFSQLNVVIPGHGKTGGRELLDYTFRLFSNK